MPDPTLQGTALRYAAGDLAPTEATAFEARLATDQDARDALAEAVRLSAAALGQPSPAPHPSFRAVIRARLLRSRERPLAWVGLGAATVAACTLIGLSLAERTEPPAAPASTVNANPPTGETTPAPRPRRVARVALAPMPRESEVNAPPEHSAVALSPCGGGEAQRSVAEIWADLSTHDHVEKARDEELRWRHKIRDLLHPARPPE